MDRRKRDFPINNGGPYCARSDGGYAGEKSNNLPVCAIPAGVACEPFRQWVIEDNFVAGRPEWEKAGAELVSDVLPYEEMKLRMLNGSHSFPWRIWGILPDISTLMTAWKMNIIVMQRMP